MLELVPDKNRLIRKTSSFNRGGMCYYQFGISEASFHPACLSLAFTLKTTKLVSLRFHVLYLSTAALLMFTERLQFWDTPGLQSVTIFFYSDQKNTK